MMISDIYPMQKKISLILLIGFIILPIMGCATIISDSTKQITIISNSDQEFEAQIGSNRFQVPGTVTVLRDGNDKIVKTNQKKCFSVTPINKTVHQLFWLNFAVFPFSTGAITDYQSGKMWRYDRNTVIQCAS